MYSISQHSSLIEMGPHPPVDVQYFTTQFSHKVPIKLRNTDIGISLHNHVVPVPVGSIVPVPTWKLQVRPITHRMCSLIFNYFVSTYPQRPCKYKYLNLYRHNKFKKWKRHAKLWSENQASPQKKLRIVWLRDALHRIPVLILPDIRPIG